MGRADAAAAAVAFVLLAVLPVIPGFGQLDLLTRGTILAAAALPLAVLVGGAGLLTLSHAASVGLGSYVVVAFDAGGVQDAAIVLPAAAAAGAGFAGVTGLVALRTSGVNFLMITLAFGEMAHYAVGSLTAYGGDDGYSLSGRTTVFGSSALDDPRVFQFACLGLLVLAWALCSLVRASRLGRVLRAGAEAPLRVQASGLGLYGARLGALAFAGAIAGVAGAMLANAAEFAAPSYLGWQRSGELLFMVVLGGQDSLGGVVWGVFAWLAAEAGLERLTEHRRLPFGILLVLAAIRARGGLSALLARPS